jgi:hypothetical protein
MKGILIPIVLIMSLMGCASALDVKNGVELRPGEASSEKLFNHGIGQPWVGGSPPSSGSFDTKFSHSSRLTRDPSQRSISMLQRSMK